MNFESKLFNNIYDRIEIIFAIKHFKRSAVSSMYIPTSTAIIMCKTIYSALIQSAFPRRLNLV